MAGLTGRSRCYMVCRFTFGSCTVMAAGTATDDACVIHFATFEACGRAVAGLTTCSRRYMVCRFTFGGCTIMTAGTARGDACMIKLSASECGCAMTLRTLARLRVSREFCSTSGARGDDA